MVQLYRNNQTYEVCRIKECVKSPFSDMSDYIRVIYFTRKETLYPTDKIMKKERFEKEYHEINIADMDYWLYRKFI